QQVTCFVSHRAHAAHLRIPLWPEMRLMLEFRDLDGTPASGIQIEHVVFPFRPIRIQAKPSDANGRTVVEGMPFLERAIISILASGRAYETRIRRRDQYTRLSRSRSFNDWIGLQDLPLTNVPEREPVRAIGTGELGVEPRWGDRERAEGVDIAMQWGTHIQRARSETGVVVFRMLPKGEGRIAVLDPALAYEERPVSLREGGKLTVTLGPAQGRSMTFVVQGRKPVAGARILASAWHGLIAPPIIDGVQQLAAVTGPGGVYVWHGFPLEEAKITAFRGGWSGEGRVGRGIRGERASVTLRPRRK
ncbi:MAG: hypothetical protein ACYS0F_09275, partial [Planctomycetota bacterium]